MEKLRILLFLLLLLLKLCQLALLLLMAPKPVIFLLFLSLRAELDSFSKKMDFEKEIGYNI